MDIVEKKLYKNNFKITDRRPIYSPPLSYDSWRYINAYIIIIIIIIYSFKSVNTH